ncbi:MAG: hypothetical protein EOO39_41420, partial [Cytophagaceae bacterium]
MADYSYPIGTRTDVLSCDFTATFTTGTLYSDDPGYIPHTRIATGRGSIGSYAISAGGAGYVRLTLVSTVICTVSSGGTIRYSYTPVSSTFTTSNVVINGQSPSPPTTVDGFFSRVATVVATASGVPRPTVPYTYTGDDPSANIDFTYSWTINGSPIDIPVYSTSASGGNVGGSGSASATNCYAMSYINDIDARNTNAIFSRFGNLGVTGSPGSYSITSDIGRAFQPRFDVDLVVQNRYLRGSTIPVSEYSIITDVLYNSTSTTVIGNLLPSEAAGRLFSSGTDSVYADVRRGDGSVSARNANLNGDYGNSQEWFRFSFVVNTATPGAKVFPSGTTTVRATAPLNPGFPVYSSLPNLTTGYALT